MHISIFDNIQSKDKDNAVKVLKNHSTSSLDYFLFMLLAMLMATLGIVMNNAAAIIGSMLIAPIPYPIMGMAMGTVISDRKLRLRSLLTFIQSIILTVIAGAIITIFIYPPGETPLQITFELLLRTQPTLPDLTVAIITGLAASLTLVKPKLSETLPGIAISVALIPPLSVIGIGLATFNWDIAAGALTLFTVNTLGVLFACVMVFSMMDFHLKRRNAKK